MKSYVFLVCSALLVLTGCATNPVTGQSEFQLITSDQEIAMGKQHYPYQMQVAGGAYTLAPELSAYVQQIGEKLVKVSDRPGLPYEFSVVNDGSWNAWALPGGKIAINRGLLQAMSNESELAAVLAHEIVHAAARHSAKQMERGMLLQVGLIGATVAVDEDWQETVVVAGSIAGGLGMLKYSRDAESESDYYGMLYMVRAGYDPVGAVTLQELFAENQNNAGGWLASHPASIQRVRQNKDTLTKFSQGGILGEESYARAVRRLKIREPAYLAYEEGVKALTKDKNTSLALEKAEEAIDLFSGEALFYSLKAQALEKSNKSTAALTAWNQAVELNPDWFWFRMERGLLHEKEGRKNLAKQDLQRSYELLPTEKAQKALSRLGVTVGE
jgi:predicted Zn-dependent protease